jgi:hypothetical protein
VEIYVEGLKKESDFAQSSRQRGEAQGHQVIQNMQVEILAASGVSAGGPSTGVPMSGEAHPLEECGVQQSGPGGHR